MMIVKKRDGREVSFDKRKIVKAILAAFKDTDGYVNDYAKEKAEKIALYIENTVKDEEDKIYSIEEIQDLVENGLMASQRKDVAHNYIVYRHERNMARKSTTEDTIFGIVGGTDEYWRFENSNKNTEIAPTQRDNIAGEVSRDISAKRLIPKHIMKAHNDGIIHFHDMDYFLQKIHNCCLINIKDMLENNTVITDILIETPHTFQKACNVTTQIIAQVASSQYGGQSVNLAHLAPFVERTRNAYRKEFPDFTDEQIERLVMRNIKDGVQTIQYQILTLMTTNGQTPFVTIYLNINDAAEGQERADFALIIEEVLKQRILGVKNKDGVFITPTFPKLIYALDENNVHPDSEFYHLTKLAAQCTAKRMVPDYISNKKQRELKEGDEYACMGCVDGSEVITYKLDGNVYIETFRTMYNKLSNIFETKEQIAGKPHLFMDTDSHHNLEIYDTKQGFVKVLRVIRNVSTRWYKVRLQNGYELICTDDHPFHTNRGRIFAKDLIVGEDKITVNNNKYNTDDISIYSPEIINNNPANTSIVDIESLEYFEKEDYSYDVTTESDHFEVSGIYSHNCRSFLTVDRTKENYANSGTWDIEKGHKYWGRFNQGVVTLNLVDVALSSKKDEKQFWEILNERLELCHEALQIRHKRLEGTPTSIAPILWQHGALARLPQDGTIDELLYHGYSTISLGYAGLYECTKYMTGESHINGTPESKEFALKVMKTLNNKCREWKVAEDIDYSVYGTPLESTTYKFAKKLRERFGTIENITDHDYITNSYHICVRENIDAFDKLTKESEFQELSPGGAISYVEVPNLQNNLDAVLALINHIYDHILYAELNTKSDYCQECGFSGEIEIKGEQGNYYWQCPQCGNRDLHKLYVVRRTCGYLGANFWNQGRTEEINERVLHL